MDGKVGIAGNGVGLLNGQTTKLDFIASEEEGGVVRFEVFTAVTMKNGVFWDVTPCGSYFFAARVGC
jgi:hypothetical protein